MNNYGEATEQKIAEVETAMHEHGQRSIIALAGVPGTGKSLIALVAAQRFAQDPLLVREVQFHQSYSYEVFVEGMRIGKNGDVFVEPGVFLEWNAQARDDSDQRYVLLIEELTRANVAAVLGELLTYVEHRDRSFQTTYSRGLVSVAPNLTILATYNPSDRSAINLDSALLRRLRVISCPPSPSQLAEMLKHRNLSPPVIKQLQTLFTACERQYPRLYEYQMPFGHGIFADVQREEPDLHRLWHERIKHMLYRPLAEPNPFAQLIEDHYPWKTRPNDRS